MERVTELHLLKIVAGADEQLAAKGQKFSQQELLAEGGPFRLFRSGLQDSFRQDIEIIYNDQIIRRKITEDVQASGKKILGRSIYFLGNDSQLSRRRSMCGNQGQAGGVQHINDAGP